MNNYRFLALCRSVLSLMTVTMLTLSSFAAAENRLTYPDTQRSDHVDTYHGVQIADPHRWLEDLDSEQTKAWVEAQNKVTFAYLERIPQRSALRQRLTKLWDFERYGTPGPELLAALGRLEGIPVDIRPSYPAVERLGR